jgi:hypothetical protein
MFTGVRLHLRAIHRNPAHLHRTRFQCDPQNLFEQALQRLEMNLAEIRDRAEVRLIPRRQNTEMLPIT